MQYYKRTVVPMRRKGARNIVILVAAGAILVAANSRGYLGFVKSFGGRGVSAIGGWFSQAGNSTGDFVHLVTSVRELNSELDQLRRENATLRTKLSEDDELRHENEVLRRQLGFGETATRRLVPAQVVGYQPDSFHQYLLIGRGSREGVEVGMAVVSEGVLVGKISEVSVSTAKVFLVIDPEFKVNGLDQETRATGTVKGQLGTGLIMDKIAQSDAIHPGDTIITSGLGGELPKGIIIGRVESINQSDNAIFQTAQIASVLKFNRLELVFVVVSL